LGHAADEGRALGDGARARPPVERGLRGGHGILDLRVGEGRVLREALPRRRVADRVIAHGGSVPLRQSTAICVYFEDRYSWMPSSPPSRPTPDCFTPPKGAAAFETTPTFNPIIPVSSRSIIR